MLANVKNYLEWDWAGAEQLYKRAIELDPNYEDAHRWYAIIWPRWAGCEEALAEARRAEQVEPLSYGVAEMWAVWIFVPRPPAMTRPSRNCRKLMEWQPKDDFGHTCLASVYLQTGRLREVPRRVARGPCRSRSKHRLV